MKKTVEILPSINLFQDFQSTSSHCAILTINIGGTIGPVNISGGIIAVVATALPTPAAAVVTLVATGAAMAEIAACAAVESPQGNVGDFVESIGMLIVLSFLWHLALQARLPSQDIDNPKRNFLKTSPSFLIIQSIVATIANQQKVATKQRGAITYNNKGDGAGSPITTGIATPVSAACTGESPQGNNTVFAESIGMFIVVSFL